MSIMFGGSVYSLALKTDLSFCVKGVQIRTKKIPYLDIFDVLNPNDKL